MPRFSWACRVARATFLVLPALLAVSPVVFAGAEADTGLGDDRAFQLVEQFGDDSFGVRQHAMRELESLGRAAKPALLAGLKSRDAEVRSRCRRVLSIVLDQDMQARLNSFAADPFGRQTHELPGWERYKKEIGDNRAARELFVEMLRSEPQLFEAAESDPRLAGSLLQARCEQLQQTAFDADARHRKLVTVGCVASLFFIGSHPDVNVTDTFVSYLHTFSYQPTFQAAMQNVDRAEPLKKILGGWISRPAGVINSYQNFMLSLQFGLREGLAPATTMLRDGAGQPHMSQYAMLLVAKFSGKDGIPLLVPFLKDQSPLGSYSVNGHEVRTELRDVALAVLVHLTGQDHTAYGFEHLQKNGQSVFLPVTAGFSDPLKRDAAIARWNAWAAMNMRAEQGLRQGAKG